MTLFARAGVRNARRVHDHRQRLAGTFGFPGNHGTASSPAATERCISAIRQSSGSAGPRSEDAHYHRHRRQRPARPPRGDGGRAVRRIAEHAARDRLRRAASLIAERDNHVVRKVDAATGVISTLAGTGVADSGDGGAASQAQLRQRTASPSIAMDAARLRRGETIGSRREPGRHGPRQSAALVSGCRRLTAHPERHTLNGPRTMVVSGWIDPARA